MHRDWNINKKEQQLLNEKILDVQNFYVDEHENFIKKDPLLEAIHEEYYIKCAPKTYMKVLRAKLWDK